MSHYNGHSAGRRSLLAARRSLLAGAGQAGHALVARPAGRRSSPRNQTGVSAPTAVGQIIASLAHCERIRVVCGAPATCCSLRWPALSPESAPPSPLSHYERPAEHESANAPTQGGPDNRAAPTGCEPERRGYELCRARNGTQTNARRASRLLALSRRRRRRRHLLAAPLSLGRVGGFAVEVEPALRFPPRRLRGVRELTWPACGRGTQCFPARRRSMGRAEGSQEAREAVFGDGGGGGGGNCISRANWRPAGPDRLRRCQWPRGTPLAARGEGGSGRARCQIHRRLAGRPLVGRLLRAATKLVSGKTFARSGAGAHNCQ